MANAANMVFLRKCEIDAGTRHMAIVQRLPKGRSFDVCVVGSGPAGLAVALSLEASGRSVLLIEAGGIARNPASSVLPVPYIEDPSVHGQLATTTREGLGGTSRVWGTLCVPFDPIDFTEREWMAESGWPIRYEAVSQWHDEAAAFLGCGPDGIEKRETVGAPQEPTDGLFIGLGRLANRQMLTARFRDRLRKSSRLTVSLNSPVTDLVLDESGQRVISCSVGERDGTSSEVRASRFVLACGGLRTTHLLLRLAARWPRHFAAGHAPLGRFYMGHLAGEIASIVFRDPRAAVHYLYRADAEGRLIQRRLQLNDARQRQTRTLNTAFTLRVPTLGDPTHESGALSLLHLITRVPRLARLTKSKRMTALTAPEVSGPLHAHAANIVRHPVRTTLEVGQIIAQSRKRRLPIVTLTASGRYSLRFHAEQAPSAESRLLLSEKGDRASPGLDIRFRYSEQDFHSVVTAHQALDEALTQNGWAHLVFHPPGHTLEDAVRSQACDGYHQIGTTRMGIDPKTSVVDADCRVHGLENLYVASSSVFPTSGGANPTFMIVALARRLAGHLKGLS